MSKSRLQPVHPGEILREEFLNPLGYSQRTFAAKIGVTHTRLNQIVQEKRSITADTALRLARALGTTAEFWMNLQARFDLDLAMDKSGARIEQEVERLPTP